MIETFKKIVGRFIYGDIFKYIKMEEDKITTIRLHESTKKGFREKFKKYPRETDEEIIIELIKKETNKDEKTR